MAITGAHFMRGLKALAAALAALSVHAVCAEELSRPDLARQYLEARGELREFVMDSAGAGHGSAPDTPQARASLKDAMLKMAGHGPDWNPQHPDWNRVATMIDQDMPEIVAELAPPVDPAVLSREIDGALVEGIAKRLTAEQLRALVDYYASPTGRRFGAKQAQLTRAVLAGFAKRGGTPAGQQKPPAPEVPAEAELKEMSGLFGEYIQIYAGLFDPGPGGDRSGLGAIPMLFGIGIGAGYPELRDTWHTVAETDRQAILAWRGTPNFRAELEALNETARDVHRISDPAAARERLVKVVGKYEKRWASRLNRPASP